MSFYPKIINLPQLAKDKNSLHWILGTWRTVYAAEGQYPTVKDFKYHEELRFTNVGSPLISYQSASWHPEKNTPIHLENGFLQIKPDSKQCSFLITSNLGYASKEEGGIEGKTISLSSSGMMQCFEGNSYVKSCSRMFKLNESGDLLTQEYHMETTKTPLSLHCKAVYKKVEE